MFVVKELAARLRPELEALIKQNDDAPGTPYAFNATACARRAIKSKALGMLTALDFPETTALAVDRFRGAANMTDSIAALRCGYFTGINNFTFAGSTLFLFN